MQRVVRRIALIKMNLLIEFKIPTELDMAILRNNYPRIERVQAFLYKAWRGLNLVRLA